MTSCASTRRTRTPSMHSSPEVDSRPCEVMMATSCPRDRSAGASWRTSISSPPTFGMYNGVRNRIRTADESSHADAALCSNGRVVRTRVSVRVPGALMTEPRTTIAVVPRESYSGTPKMLDALVAHTPQPRRVVVVDGGSPRSVLRQLERLASACDFTLIHREAAF